MESKMKKLIATGLLLFLIAGCGHNVVTYSDGIGVDVSVNPETYTLGLNLRYGKILTAVVKEKTKLDIQAGLKQESGLSSENNNVITGVETKLKFETGDQVNGYVVELEKQKNNN
jgi:hypothetical protein